MAVPSDLCTDAEAQSTISTCSMSTDVDTVCKAGSCGTSTSLNNCGSNSYYVRYDCPLNFAPPPSRS
jgi:hypothetical protein